MLDLEGTRLIAFRTLDVIFNLGDLSIMGEVFSTDIVAHVPGIKEELKGLDALKSYMKNFLLSFEDIHLDMDKLHQQGDTVDTHATFTATNIGPFLDLPSVQKRVEGEPVFFFRFDTDNKIVEYSWNLDIASMMQ